MSWLRRSLLLGVLALAGCPKAVPNVVDQPAPDAGLDPQVARLEAFEREVAEVLRAQDEAMWAHWTTGAPLDLSRAAAGHAALFTKDTLGALRALHEGLSGAPARRAAHLERWLAGELLARAVAEENDAIASLEAALTFAVDGRETAWRELPRLLLTEKSAVKRRALWKASLEAAARLDAALARRDAKAQQALAALDIPSTLQLAAETRELDLDELARAAEALLASTEEAWRAALQRQADADVRLPLASLTRAELPRLLRFSPAVEAAFPRDALGARAVALLGGLGVCGRPGLTLDLADGAKKNPLPLTVAPGPKDVRVSFRPAGGLRDQAALFSELGAALALAEARTGSVATERLGDPASVLVLADVFGGLVASPRWLEAAGVPAAARDAVVDAWNANRLFVVRRAAGVVLVRLETQGLPDAEARARFVAIMSRALALPPAEADGVRWRIDTDDFLRSATQLKAAALARVVRARLPDDWFASADGWRALATSWAQGTAVPLEARIAPLGQATGVLSQALGGAPLDPGPWPAPARAADAGASASTSPSTAATQSSGGDGGLTPGPWPAPARVADAGVSATSSPSTAAAASPRGDGGLKPGPWPAPARVADGGVSATSSPSTASAASPGADGGLKPGRGPHRRASPTPVPRPHPRRPPRRRRRRVPTAA